MFDAIVILIVAIVLVIVAIVSAILETRIESVSVLTTDSTNDPSPLNMKSLTLSFNQ